MKLRHYGNTICIEALAMMQYGDITATELSARTKIDRDTCAQWLAGMVHVGLAHIVEWRISESRKGPRQPVHRIGDGESLLPPNGVPRTRKMRMANLPALKLLWVELEHASTRAELVEASGFCDGTVKRLLRRMRELRIVRVCGHVPRPDGVGGVWIEQLRRGSGPDAKRPAPRPQIEHARAYYLRKKQAAANGGVLAQVWAFKAAA